MHYREQGRTLQFIRTVYDPEKRRGVQQVVGKIPQYTYVIPDEVLPLLTPEEVLQTNDYLAVLKAAREERHHAYTLSQAVESIGKVTSALKTGHAPKDQAQADAIWEAMAELGRALKKAGHKRPVAEKKPAVPAGQKALDV